MPTLAARLEESQRRHGAFLWGLCYRMTGVAADADELVQETWVRAMSAPPARLDLPLEPWLTRVAMNLATDRLRQRKQEQYIGPWLPSPIDTEAISLSAPASARYECLESVSFAFLLALEVLTPTQRAVLVLRDVFDVQVAQTAELLELSESNVKTTHHRARALLEGYDANRVVVNADTQRRSREALEAFFAALISGDMAAMTTLLRDDVKIINDGAGQYSAARKIIVGREQVVRFQQRLIELRGVPEHYVVRMINGMPGVLMTFAQSKHKEPPRSTASALLDAEGRIMALISTVADRKLSHVWFA